MASLSPDLFWLAATATLTALMWLPYILNRVLEQGLEGAVLNPAPPSPAKAAWAERLRAAHANMAVALAIFASLVLSVQAAGLASPGTALACQLFFWARLAHAVVYTLGVPMGRTLAFTVAFLCQMVLAWTVLG